MYVINKKNNIINTWEDNERNRQRIASSKYNVSEYIGEIEIGYDGLLYAKGNAPMQMHLTYQEKRLLEYPHFGEQLDMIFHDLDSWKAKITEIKAKYPKVV